MFDIPAFKSVLPSFVTMKANTAIAFLLSGIALWLLHQQYVPGSKRRIAQLCALIIVAIGGLTLSQYLFNWDLGIDQLVFREMSGAIGTSHPGRMAPSTALNFTLIGLALLLLGQKIHRCYWYIQFLTLAAALMVWQPLLGYAYKFEPLYGIASFTHMALHTALTFLVLCVGILFVRPGRGVMRIVTSNSTGGFVARRLLLAAIAFPSVLGYVILQGERARLYNSAFGLSLLVIANIVVFAIWIWQNAEILTRSDNKRKRAEAEIVALNQDLHRRVSEFQTLFDVIPISIAIAEDPECRHIRVNSTFAQLLQISPDANACCTPPSSSPKPPYKVLCNGRELPGDEQPLQYAAAHSTEVRDAQIDIVRDDGARFNLFGFASPLLDEQSKPRGAVTAFLDITERKRHQALLAAQARILEMIATGVALSEILHVLVELIEEQSDQALCSLLLLNSEGTMLGRCIAPSLPEPYKAAANQGVPIGACACSCGTAVYRREPVIVSDIANDPLWADSRDLALSHGLQACWSLPIFASNGDVLGTFAMYYRKPRDPSPQDWQLVELSTHLAGIAIERQRAESALRESEERFRKFFEQAPIGIGVIGSDYKLLKVNQTYCEMLGYTEPELNQLTFAAITHPDDVATNVSYAEQLFKGEIPSYQMEKRYIKKNGESLWVNLTVTRITEQDGKVGYGLAMVQDITERKHIQEALSDTNQTLQALIQACPLAISVFSVDDGLVKMWNPAAEHIFGWSEQEVLGRFLPSVPEEKRDEFLRNLEFIREGRALTGLETRRQKKGGLPIDINVWAAPLRDARGNVSCMSIVADISDRKQAEAALKESEERFRKLTEKVRVIPWEADPITGKFTYVGPQTVEILGYPLTDWYADDFWSEHIHPDDKDWALAYCQDKSVVLDNYEFEYRMLAADGRIVWLYDIVNVVRSNGHPSLLRGFMIDITERKRAEEEREQLLAREQAARAEAEQARSTAESANRMKDEFLATLSHELRTPLNPMLGWIQMLRTRKLDEATTARALETIDRNTKSLATLIEDVLDVSRIIRGKLHLNIRPIELVPVIDAAIDTIRPAAQAKDIQFESVLDSSVGLVLGDANRLQQVIWNLLSNAVKFTPKGGKVEVQLSVLSGQSPVINNNQQPTTDKYVQIRVSDTGKGIAPEFLPYVFDRFRQENSSTTRTYGGLGLGLAIVRHLVELHGGTVYADSPGEGRGATFSVYLPRL